MTMSLNDTRIDTTPMDRIAMPWNKGIFIPNICESNQKVAVQKLDIAGHGQSMWPVPQFLKHRGEASGIHLEIMKGVKYHRSSIFWVNSHRLTLFIAAYCI